MIVGVHHVSISVTAMASMLAFYRDLLGFAVVHDSEWQPGNARIDAMVGLQGSAARVVMLRAANIYVELFEYRSPKGRQGNPNRPVCDAGLTHLCLVTDDIEAEYDRLRNAGLRFHAPPGAPSAFRACYGRDPEGNIFELIEFAADHSFAFDRLKDHRGPLN